MTSPGSLHSTQPAFDNREKYERERLEETRQRICDYRLPPQEFDTLMKVWKESGWPLGFLLSDHYGAKVVHDNDIFQLINFYNHKFEFSEEDGLLLKYKSSKNTPTQMTPLANILPHLPLEVSEATNRWHLDGFAYTEDGLQRVYDFHYNAAQFEAVFKRWSERGWPVGLLMRDHFAAKVIEDTGLLYAIPFFGHEWRWDDKSGFQLQYRAPNESVARLRAWDDVMENVDFIKTVQGFFYFDGVCYTSEGLTHRHLWKWQNLEPCYTFDDEEKAPDYAYVDLVVGNWDWVGNPGVGVDGAPHGHTYVELGDAHGHVWAVGQYPAPESLINIGTQPLSLGKAVLMSPDFYFYGRGDRSMHRYELGRGDEGEAQLRKLLAFIDDVQDYHVDERSGEIVVCSDQHHSFVDRNCVDFTLAIERYVRDTLGAKLVAVDASTKMHPLRTVVSGERGYSSNIGNRIYLFLFDWIFMILLTMVALFVGHPAAQEKPNRAEMPKRVPPPKSPSASLRRRGAARGAQSEESVSEESVNEEDTSAKRSSNPSGGVTGRWARGVYEKLGALRRRLRPMQFPRRLRVEQLYGHCVDAGLRRRMFDVMRSFFALPEDVKSKICDDRTKRGYTKLRAETLDPKNQSLGDTKEGFYIGRHVDAKSDEAQRPLHGPNCWPSESVAPDFKTTCLEYYDSLLETSNALLPILARSLDLPSDYFSEMFRVPLATLRLLKYETEGSRPNDGVLGCGEHSDYGMLTLLLTDGNPGLQLRRRSDSAWMAVPNIEDAFVVNIGDALARATNDLYRSTRHRVVISGESTRVNRYSIPFFFEPSFDAIVKCLPSCCSDEEAPKYQPVQFGEYLLDRYSETYN